MSSVVKICVNLNEKRRFLYRRGWVVGFFLVLFGVLRFRACAGVVAFFLKFLLFVIWRKVNLMCGC